jgi:hypothetical protein
VTSLLLLAAGLAIVGCRPCRRGAARAPRSAIGLLLTATAAVWVGSLGVVVAVVSGELGSTVAACGVLWRQLLTGQLAWWHTGLVAAWIIALPGRGTWSLLAGGLRSRRLRRTLRTAAFAPSDAEPVPARTLVVPGLSTPAVSLGVLRPVILVDADFWSSATSLQRQVVLAHEDGHRRGRHVLVDGAGRALTSGLAPLPAASAVYDCVRRHLEALADDAAVRRHGRHSVGLEVGRIALAAVPTLGLGAAGSALWRVERLLTPPPRRPLATRLLLLVTSAVLAVGLTAVLGDTVVALGPVISPQFCPV